MYMGKYNDFYALANELSENEQYFGGSQFGGLGIITFISMQQGRKAEGRKLAIRILENDNSINLKKSRRAMKTFIIVDKVLMLTLKETLEEAEILV